MSSILELKKTLERPFLNMNGVCGIGLSIDESIIIIYVEKITDELIYNIPNRMGDFPVNIIEIGKVTTHFEEFDQIVKLGTDSTDFVLNQVDNIDLPILSINIRKQQWRPLVGGISIAHQNVSAGTLATLCKDANTGEILILSNNHVLANASTNSIQDAHIGDKIFQPSLYDGGTEFDNVATLERYIPFDGTNINKNIVDCAVAKPNSNVELITGILGDNEDNILKIHGVASIDNSSLKLGDRIKVKKAGRTTGYTEGYITDINFTTVSNYGENKIIRFSDQILAEINLDGGDSGSLLLDEENKVVGLIFAGTNINGKTYAIANKINNVLTMLNIEIPYTNNSNTNESVATTISPKFSFLTSLFYGFTIGGIIFGSGYTSNKILKKRKNK